MRLAKVKRGWMPALLVMSALAVIACGDPETATPMPPTQQTPAAAAPTPSQQANATVSAPTTSDDGALDDNVLDDQALVETDPDALQQYLDAVGPAFQKASHDRQAVDQDLTAPAPGRTTHVDDAAAWFARVGEIKQGLAQALQNVDPPTSLGSVPNELALAMSEWAALADRVLEVLADAGPEFDVSRDLANVPDLGITDAGRMNDRARFFCASIERLAADNGLDVDLGCIKILR